MCQGPSLLKWMCVEEEEELAAAVDEVADKKGLAGRVSEHAVIQVIAQLFQQRMELIAMAMDIADNVVAVPHSCCQVYTSPCLARGSRRIRWPVAL